MGDVIVETLCVPMLVAAILLLQSFSWTPMFRAAIVIVGLVLLAPLAQLIPLPPTIWTDLPGRAAIAQGFRLAQADPPWLGVSLTPAATLQGFFSLVPPVTIFVATVQLNLLQRRLALAVTLTLAVISVMLGLLQAADVSDSMLRPYANSPFVTAISGFFANRNHFAAMMSISILIAATWVLTVLVENVFRLRNGGGSPGLRSLLLLVSLGATLASLVLGVILAQSRAGFGLAITGIVVAFPIALIGFPQRSIRRPAALMVGLVALLVAVALNYLFFETLQRIQLGAVDIARDRISALSRPLLAEYFPLGSGFGSFLPVFSSHETPTTALIAPVNRAHNDFLEWGIEGGVVAYLILGFALTWLVVANVHLWRQRPATLDVRLARACGVAPIFTLLHSLVDYPLRTLALTAIIALCAGICVEPLARTRHAATRGSRGRSRKDFRSQSILSVSRIPR